MTASATTGAELWEAFVADAGLQLTAAYDAALVEDVAVELGLGGGDLAARMVAAGTSTTDVLVAVLNAVQPWTAMMRDLLAMMRAAGATTTQTQLRADVDIADASARIDLDLEHFTEALDAYETVSGLVTTRLWSPIDLTALWSFMPPRELSGVPLPADVQRWIQAYSEPYSPPIADVPWPWPAPGPPLRTGHAELDEALASTYRAWVAAVVRMREAATTRRELYELNHADTSLDDDLHVLAPADHDNWAASVLEGLHELAAHVAAGGWDWTYFGQTRTPQELINHVAGLPTGEAADGSYDALRRLLSLPVWGKRYDVYSNWVFTRIVDALEGTGLAIEAPDGTMRFAFAATCTATIPGTDPAVAVYSELRSPLRGPSRKRKHDVQPDYSILAGDAADAASASVAEVECKQYQRASPSNFGPALHDYALARPQAEVVLVSYGPISAHSQQSTMALVGEPLRPRCRMIGEFRPGSKAALHGFGEAVRDAVRASVPDLVAPRLDPSRPATIELRWAERSTRDLDLHLDLDIDGSPATISYKNPNYDRAAPFAWLVRDIQSGPGPEVIEVERWQPGSYRVSVHDFGDGDLADSVPEVIVTQPDRTFTFARPPGPGAWWEVLSIDGTTGTITGL